MSNSSDDRREETDNFPEVSPPESVAITCTNPGFVTPSDFIEADVLWGDPPLDEEAVGMLPSP